MQRAIRRQHLAHHLHNEQGNLGVASSIRDRLPGTRYAQARDAADSYTRQRRRRPA